MKLLIELLNQNVAKGSYQGSEKSLAKARKRGKLLARERLEYLLDKDSPFLELMPIAGLDRKGTFGTGGTSVCGVGFVSGRLCMINSNVGTRKGGSIDSVTMHKSLRAAQIAIENQLPLICFVESGGGNLPEQDKIFNYGGANFRDLTRMSRKRIPTISVVFGNATAGGAYVPGTCDYAVFVKDKAKVFLAGPPLVKMATNEVVDDESLGGAAMHSRVSGVSDYLAEDEIDGIRIAREIVETIADAEPQYIPSKKIAEPVYSPEELLGVISPNIKIPLDIREVINRITDGSKFSEFKPEYGNTLVTGWAEIFGYKVGIIGNNGVIFSESANKGAQFIQLCNKNNVPIIYLQNTTGFMVGKAYEEGGIIKDGAKMINAVSNSDVPTITVLVGSSYGAGNYAMNGLAFQPNFLFMYPNAKIGIMGSEQLAGVMEIVQRAATKSAGEEYNEEQAKMMRDFMMKEVEKKSTAWYSARQFWDDGTIDPRETRNYLGFALAIVHNKKFKGSDSFGVFRM
ncbi:UNVERIFIED_CONTAM: hypothetical protein GTU68_002850 [Idotea baltica]|nr:hypothetical protein [Idotea baltica]